MEYSFFLYCYIKYLYDQDEFFNLENGSSGIKNLDYKSFLFDTSYILPLTAKMILDFNDNVKDFFKKINSNKLQICNVTKLRNTVLPKWMNNEIKVEDHEIWKTGMK